MGMQNALTAGMSRHTSLYVIAGLTMIEAIVFSIVFGVTLDEIDDNRRIVGLQEDFLKISGLVIIGTYLIAFFLSFGLIYGAAKKKPVWLKIFFFFGIVKCILKVAVATIFINGRIIVAAGVLVIICAVLNTYFIAIIAATEKEMKKLLISPIATAPVVASHPRPFVGNQDGLQAPYNPGLRTFVLNTYFIAIIAATEKEMKKLLISPIATAPVVASHPRPFVGNQDGLQAPYNPGLRTFGNNDDPASPSYNRPFGSRAII